MAISNPVVLDQNTLGGPGSTASISPASGSLLLVFIELFSVPNTAITLSGQADGDGWTVVSDDFVVDRTRQVVLAAKASGATESISITTPGGLPCHYFVVSATLTGAFTASTVVAQSSFEADFTTVSGANLATAPTAMTLTMTSWGTGSPYTHENTQLGTPLEDTGTNRYIGLDYAASGDQQSTMTHNIDVAWRSTSIELVDSQVAGDLTASISQVGPYKAGDTLRIDLANATNASGKTAAIIDTATATGTTTINLAVTAQAIDYIDVTIPELHNVDGLLGKYGDTFTITVTDGSDTDTIDIPITEPDAHNAQTVNFGEITALGGLFDGIPGVATGMHCYAEFLSGDSSIIFNAQTGSITEPNQDTQILVAIWDSNGVGSGTRTFLYQAASDVTPPEITLNGSTPIDVEFGSVYVDAGATANDFVDGNLTSSISVGGDTVNTSALGTYTITYDESDSSGNAATQVSRVVNVVDTIAPVLTLVGNASVSHTQGQPFTDQGANWTDAVDGSGSVTADTPLDVNTLGAQVLTYNRTDSSGNAATQVTRTVTVEAAQPVSQEIQIPSGIIQTVRPGGTYSDPAALAIDSIGANVTDTITWSGDTIDTNVALSQKIILTTLIGSVVDSNTLRFTRTQPLAPGSWDAVLRGTDQNDNPIEIPVTINAQ